jgi:Zn-dependent alcohol dehydrogenase
MPSPKMPAPKMNDGHGAGAVLTDRAGQTAISSIYMCDPETTAWEVSVMPPDTAIAVVIRVPWKETTAPKTILRCVHGAVGLSAGQGGTLAGASRTVAPDMHDPKPDLTSDPGAADLGATHTVNASSAGPVAAVRAITGGRGVDCVLEAAGNEASFHCSTEACRPGGEIVWFGKVEVNPDVSIRWSALIDEKRITRSRYRGAQTATDFPTLALYLRGDLLLDGLITQRITLQEINRGFDNLKAGRAIRPVIVFGDVA